MAGLDHTLNIKPMSDKWIKQQQRIAALESQLEAKNQEIARLNQVWKRLRDCQRQIGKLTQALKDAEKEINDRRVDDIELYYLSERLNQLVEKQQKRTFHHYSPPPEESAAEPSVALDKPAVNSAGRLARKFIDAYG